MRGTGVRRDAGDVRREGEGCGRDVETQGMVSNTTRVASGLTPSSCLNPPPPLPPLLPPPPRGPTHSHTLDGITMNEDDGGRVAQHQVVDEREVRQRCGRRRDQRQLGQALHERGNEVRRQEAANKSHICVPPPAPSMCAYL